MSDTLSLSKGEWKEYSLAEIYKFSSGLSKGREEFGFGYGFLSYKDIFDNYFVPNVLKSLVNSTDKERMTCSIKRGDVFLTRTSETDDDLGISSVALTDYKDATFNGFTKRLRPLTDDKILPEFAGFYFRSPRFRAVVSGMSSITTRASLNNSMLSNIAISIPPLNEQQVISNILISLHNKIDLLHRQNKTLEQLAETLFRQWFVEEAEEKLEIGEVSTVTTGKGLKREEFIVNGLYPILGANGEIGRTDKYLTDNKLILTGRVGTLGKVYISEGKVWISDNVLIINPFDEKFFYPIYFYLKTIDFENLNVGSTQPLVTQTELKKIGLKIPHKQRFEEFVKICAVSFKKISENKFQIRTLTQLRDTLLPKLMSGEIRLNCDSYD